MLLSIGMMVKNEGKHLDECLKSLQPILNNIDSELIIVDTGSEDNTVEIAKKYTDKVYFHKWNNNFSEMRNKVLSYCKGDWYMVIDGDEVFEDCNDVIEFFISKEFLKYRSATIVGKNIFDERDISKFSSLDTLRLFKRDSDFRYEGRVHNQPVYKKPIKVLASSILHYGYVANDKELMERKFERTGELLRKELEKNPESLYYRYQLSVTYGMHGDLKEALEEAEKAYKSLCNSKEEYLNCRYIYMQYANMLLENGYYDICEKIAMEGLNLSKLDTVDKIDLYYYLSKAQTLLGKNESAVNNYSNYLELLDKYKNKNIILDAAIISYTLGNKDSVYLDLISIFSGRKNWIKVKEILNKLEGKNIIMSLYTVIFITYNELKDYRGLVEYYNKKICIFEDQEIEEFFKVIEKEKLKLNKDEIFILEKEFTHISDDYGDLNRIRVDFNIKKKACDFYNLEERIKKNKASFYYGDLLYYKLKEEKDINYLLENSRYDYIKEFFVYLFNKYEDFSSVLLNFIKSYNIENSFKDIRLIKIYLRYLLVMNKLEEDELVYVSDLYLNLGIKYIKYVYSEYLLEHELISECKNNEDIFHIYIMKAFEAKEKEKKTYIKFLKKSLQFDEAMHKVIEILLNKVNEKSDEEKELEILKASFIKNIDILVANNEIDEAEQLIEQYVNILGKDLEILMLKSRINILKNNYIN